MFPARVQSISSPRERLNEIIASSLKIMIQTARRLGEPVMSRSAVLSVVLAVFAWPAAAHHGPGTFDLSQTVTLTGKLTRIDLINPHSWLYFDVNEPDGRVTHHRCEMRSVHVLRRSGWSKEQFPAGKAIVVEAAPDRIDPSSCYLNTIRFGDGAHMDRYGQYGKGAGG